MLKITKNQIVKGQRVVVTNLDKPTDRYSDMGMAQESFKRAGYKDGDVITISKVTGTSVEFLNPAGKKSSFWWSCFKAVTELEEGSENLGKDKIEYIVVHNGKRIGTKKYSDMSKVKASMLSLMNYYDKLQNLIRRNNTKVPELSSYSYPEFLGSHLNLTRNDFATIEIYEWANRKQGSKVSFDAQAYYDECMLLLKVTSEFGSSARDLFKEIKDAQTHEYILTFVHEDYKKPNMYHYDDLKESDTIKLALKQSKVKGTKKKTKQGKTSIALKEVNDVITLMRALPVDSFYVMNLQGEALVEQSEALVVMENRDRKLSSLIS